MEAGDDVAGTQAVNINAGITINKEFKEFFDRLLGEYNPIQLGRLNK